MGTNKTAHPARSIADDVRQLAVNESGTTAIEYGLLAGLIAVACIVAFAAFGSGLANVFMNWVLPALAAL